MDAPTGDAALVGASSYDVSASYVHAASYDDATLADSAAINDATLAIAAASVDGAFACARTTAIACVSGPGTLFGRRREARGDQDQ